MNPSNKSKVLFWTYYRYPCTHPVLENIFAKNIGNFCDSLWLLQGDTSSGNVKRWYESKVILSRNINGSGFFSKIANRVLCLEKYLHFIKLLKRKNLDIVFVRDLPIEAAIILYLKKKFNFKFKIYFQCSAPLGDMNLEYSKLDRGIMRFYRLVYASTYNKLLNYVFNGSDIIFTISKYHKESLIHLVDPKKMIPVTMGVDSEWLERIPNTIDVLEDIKDNFRFIGYFGTLSLLRNPRFILEVFSKVKVNIPNIKLLLIGNASNPHEMEILKELCVELGIKNDVIFVGHVNRSMLQDYLNYCALTVSPIPPMQYYKISSPTKVYESLGHGVPVIANKEIYEQANVIEKSGGGVLVDYTVTSFAEGIIKVIGDGYSLNQMAQKGKNYIKEHYTYEKIASSINKYFEI